MVCEFFFFFFCFCYIIVIMDGISSIQLLQKKLALRHEHQKAQTRQHLTSWLDLPQDLLHLILIRLCICEYHSFQRVCPTWRAGVKQGRNQCVGFPLLIFPNCDQCNTHSHRLVSPSDGRSDGRLYMKKPPEEFGKYYSYLCSFYGWLLIPYDVGNVMFLLNPFTGAQLTYRQWCRT